MKKITDLELKNKTVLLRVDYNVPIENGIIKMKTPLKRRFLFQKTIKKWKGKTTWKRKKQVY